MAGPVLPSMGGHCVGDQESGKMSLPPDIHSELIKNSEHGVIINGVISWILAQKETNPPEIWKNIALQHYNDDERKKAWKEMYKLKDKLREVDPKLGFVQVNSRLKPEKELDDIEEAINKLTEAKSMPLIMASSNMILRAPIFWGKDKGGDIAGVTAELRELKQAMVGFMKQSEKQISDLKQEVMTASVSVGLSKPRINLRPMPSAPVIPLTPGGSAKRTRFDFENEVEVINNSEDTEKDWTEVSYAAKAASKKDTASEALAALIKESKNIEHKKSEKSTDKVIYGSSKSVTEGASLAGDVTLVAFGVNKECSQDAMKAFLIDKGIDVVDVTDMTREEVLDSVRVKTMKVVVKASEYEKVMEPSNWPCRVGVRLWKDKEAQKARYERWQERLEQNRSRAGSGQDEEKVQPKGSGSGQGKFKPRGSGPGAKTNQGLKPGGAKRGNGGNNQKNFRYENRYKGNIFEELLRQVLSA